MLSWDSKGLITEGADEERKALALAEFVIRHQREHLLYPRTTETTVVTNERTFIVEKAEEDPTFYRLLVQILGDEMVGIQESEYLALFDAQAQGTATASLVYRMVLSASSWLADLDEAFLHRP